MSECSRPVSDEALVDWWTGELAAPERRRVDHHLLACAHCSARAAQLAGLAHGVRSLVSAEPPVVLAPLAVEKLRHEGRRVREYRIAPGGGVRCTVGPDDDVVVARLAVDLQGVARLDVAMRIAGGPERRFSEIPFDRAAGEVVLSPPADILALPAHVAEVRLLAVDPAGERLLGEYRLDHSPWPGP